MDNRLKIGLTIMDRGAQTKSFIHQDIYEAIIEALIKKILTDRKEISFYLFSQCYGPGIDHDDREVVKRIYARLVDHTDRVLLLEDFHDAMEIKAAFKCMDCIIGTRMHTGILAMSELVPAVLIGYQPKTFGVMEALGLERYCMDIETLNIETLYDKVLDLLAERENIRKQIHHRLVQIQQQLEHWPDYLGD
jgi:polysaccharide pyruvyl transferase WcaK-like protein